LRVKIGTLDQAYLKRMAEQMGVNDLLTQAFDEAGGD